MIHRLRAYLARLLEPPIARQAVKAREAHQQWADLTRPAATPTRRCCDMHNQRCEPPSDLCCHNCTEAGHDTFPVRHADGTRCVLDVHTARPFA